MYKFFICVILGILLFIFLNTNESLNIGGQPTARRELARIPSEPAPPPSISDPISLRERRVELRNWHNTQMNEPPPNTGDIVEVYTPGELQIIADEFPDAYNREFTIHDDLQNGDIGVIERVETLNIDDIMHELQVRPMIYQMRMATVRMYRPLREIQNPEMAQGLLDPWRLTITRLILAYAVLHRDNIRRSPLNIIPLDLLEQIIDAMNNIFQQIRLEPYRVPVDRLRITLTPLNTLNTQMTAWQRLLRTCGASLRTR